MKSLARFLVWGCLLAAVLASAVGRFAPASMWWAELLRYAPYPGYVVPAVLVALLSWRLRWPDRLAAVATLCLVFGCVMGLAWGRPDTGRDPLRFMTYNVKAYIAVEHAGGFVRLADEIRRHDPDVLVMQDAMQIVDALGGHPQFAEEERKAGIDALLPWLRGRHTYAFGQYVVTSRLPLAGCVPLDMSVPGSAEQFVHCELQTPAGPVDLFTAHFVSPRDGLNAARRERLEGLAAWRANYEERLSQARMVAGAVAAARHPVILAGDLNAEDDSPVVRHLLQTGLRDAFASAAFGYGYTHGHSLHVGEGRRSGISFLRIDHVLVGPAIGVKAVTTGGKQASEHRPVIADLWLTR